MKKEKSVFLYGYYGLSNLGDDLLVHSIVSKFIENEWAKKFYVRNVGEIKTLNDFESVFLTDQEGKLIGCNGVIEKVRALILYVVNHWAIIRKTNAFILGGGTLISNHMSTKSLFLLGVLVAIAKLNNVKVFGLGLGLGKVEARIGRRIAKFILNHMEVVCVRDQSSLECGRQMAPKANYQLTADLVFSSSFAARFSVHEKKQNQHGNKVIGITLVEPFLNKNTHPRDRQLVLSTLADCIKIWSKEGIVIKLLCFQDTVLPGEIQVSDSAVFLELLQLCDSATMDIVEMSGDIDHLKQVYSGLDLVIGMRFHGMILAALASVPFVGFSCDKKMLNICDSYSMPASKLSDINVEWLLLSASAAIKKSVPASITNNFIEEANKNFNYYYEYEQRHIIE